MPYSTEFLLSAYRTMKTIREFEERCVKEFEGRPARCGAAEVPGAVPHAEGLNQVNLKHCYFAFYASKVLIDIFCVLFYYYY